MTMRDTERENSSDAIQSFVGRLFAGALAWVVGSLLLVAFVALSSLPYGGGSVGPLVLALPWTVGIVYWIVRPLGRLSSLTGGAPVLLITAVASSMAFGAIYWLLGSGDRERARAENEFAVAFKPHSTHFNKLCASAGPKVFRQVRDIEGFVVLGLRTKTQTADLRDKTFSGDVYSQTDTSLAPEDAFVRQFLTKLEWEARSYTPDADVQTRYGTIEFPAVVDGVVGFYRYTDSSVRSEFKAKREFIKTATSAYGVKIEDISTPVDREHWIAGTKWTVVHLDSNEVLGEFTAFAIDPLQGQTVFKGGAASAGEPKPPWNRAGNPRFRTTGVQLACPEKDIFEQRLNARDFLRSVLVPRPQEIRVIPER